MSLRIQLLPWDRPLLPQAVEFLARDWPGGGPLDLSTTLVVVPTRQSGRRLREGLASWAAARGQAVFSPQVVLPENLVTRSRPAAGAASPLESLVAWTRVLLEVDLSEFREVFPIDPPSRTFAWAVRLAGKFARLKAALGEAGLRLADVGQRAGDSFEEPLRWQQIAELERRYTEKLAASGRTDVQDLALASVVEPQLPAGIRCIVMLATPDPLPLAVRALATYARAVPVDLVAYGPPGGEALFDAWGCPRTEAWTTRELELAGFEQHVHLCADPLAQAGRVVDCARRYGAPEGVLAVGVADSDVLPFLENGLARAGFATFAPEGRPFRQEALFALLEALATVARERTFEAAASLARCPDVLAFLAAEAGSGRSAARLLAGLDELRCRHLPPTLRAAQAHLSALEPEYPELPSAVGKLAGLEAALTQGSFPDNVVRALGSIFGHRWFDVARAADARLAAMAEAWGDLLRQAAASRPLAGELAANDWWELVLPLFGEGRRFDDKPAGAVELQGWLELLWEDAPHLVVAGLNDGRVPESIVGDPFLPESLREKLGLKTNAARFARDAYLLQALAACRARGGRLDLLLGKTSAAGDPLRPSRLLLRCPDAELPQRVAYLFRPAEATRATLAWQRAWLLRPRAKGAPHQLSVTAFRDYLSCPFRFYLARVLGMRAVDAAKTEMDALDFGDVCHGALEAMGREPALRDCTEARTLREFLLTELERIVRIRFGNQLALPLVVQLESARQRLTKAAEIQARERAEGWVIERAEWRFPDAPARTLGGLVVRGKIDRIDRHEGSGAWRVLDYKTSDTAVTPREAHCRRAGRTRGDERAPDLARFAIDGAEYLWIDLQLPLYLWALEQEDAPERPAAGVACGYFHLPKAIGETGVTVWSDYSAAWQAAALRCAGAVAEAIRAERFWPPAEHVDHDEFAALFHHGTAESVAREFAHLGEGRP
ncbi:MAG TPA: PD-(D/E)XK nuclease family protein [Opitutaceae bacterium]|nr:PD-(D/E)XK nuclease family protein [Opitutaceae bacterium]